MPNATNRPLSIGFIIDTNIDGNDGVQQYVKTLGAWLLQQGHSVHYLTSGTKKRDYEGAKVHSLANDIRLRFNGNRVSIPLWASGKAIKRVFDDNSFDVLHVQAPYSPLLAQRVITKAGPTITIVATFHILPAGRIQYIGTKIIKLLYGRSLGRVHRWISVSQPAKHFASATLGVDSQVIPNTVVLRKFISKPLTQATNQVSKSERTIVYLGRLVERKGCAQLITAFGLLKLNPEFKDVKLKIGGDGPRRADLEHLTAELNLSSEVEFLGFIDEDIKPAFLASAEIACFPALHGESFGIVLIEAMAAGSRVVLGGDNPGYRSVLGEQEKLLVDASKPIELCQRLQLLLRDELLAKELHAWQGEHVKQYDVSVVGNAVVDVYRQSIANRQQT